jgi:serine/threonine protein kinase
MTTLRAGGSTAPREPVLIGPYRPVQRIGEGGMGVVHLALDPAGRAVALKVLRDHVCADPEARARLRREVETLRRVRTPHVAEVLDADLDGDRPYLVTRFVPGRTLEDRVRAEGPLAAPDAVRVGLVLAQALTVIHQAGVVHRDVKPANVLLLDGDPVLVDFGIAHIAHESRITRTGLVMGTPGYLSPEVVGGWPVTPATDWWGWGATLAFAASGRSPFGSGPVEVVLDRVRSGRADFTGVDRRLVPVLQSALAADPRRRPPAPALIAMLQRATSAPPPDAARTVPAPFPPVPPTRRQPPPPLPPSRAEAPRPLPPTRTASAPPPSPAPPPRPFGPTRSPAPPSLPVGRQVPEPATRVRPRPEWTRAVLLAALAAFAGAAAVAPGVTLVAFLALTTVARTVDRTATGLLQRRMDYGPRPSDGVVAVLALPWRLLTSGVASVVAAILPSLVGLATAFVMASALTGGTATMRPGTGPALAAAAVAVATVAWWGPGGSSLRRGSRTIVRGLAPARGARAVLIALLLAGALLAAGARAAGAGPDVAPFPTPQLPAWAA